MKKKTLSLFLVLIMCLSLMPAGVFAQDAVQEQTPEQTETVIDPEQQEPDAEQEESAGAEQDEEEAHVSENDAVVALQAMIDDLPEQVTEENADAVTAQLATIEDAMEDMTDEQLDKLEADRYEAAVAALAQLGGGDTPAIMAAANAVTKYDLWVGGVQVTSENKDRIPGASSGKASYDPDTKILTLVNATINKTAAIQESYSICNSAIYCSDDSDDKPVVEKIELKGSNRVTCNGNQQDASGTFRMIYAKCDYFTITGAGSLEVTAGDCTSNLPFYSNAIYCSGCLTIDKTTVMAYGGNINAKDVDNRAIDLSYYGGKLILKNAKVTGGSKRNMTKPPASSSGFKYSELGNYRTLIIRPTEGHEHYICGGQYKCDATHAEESSLTKFTEWSNAKELPKDKGSYYLTTDVTLSEAWTPTANINLCLNGHKISGPDDADVISVTDGIAVTVADCGGDTAASSEAQIYHEDGVSGNGVNIVQGGTFTLYGGKITSNTRGVNNAGTFNMYGGSITGNNNDNGAGGVANKGMMQMYGGSITGNSSAAGVGAVQTESGSIVKLGGSSKITDNTSSSEGTACNLYLADGVTFTVDNSDDLYFKGKAGISAYNQETLTNYDNILTISQNVLSSDTSPYSDFVADNTNYEMCKDTDGKLALRMARAAVSLDCSYGMDYNGTEQTGVRKKTGYTLEGDAKATKPGDYTVTATLEEGYKWNDNSVDQKTYTWQIYKRTAQPSDFTFTPKLAAYTGKAKTPKVALNSTLAQNGGYGDLTVEYRNVKNYTYLTADQVIDVGKYYVYVSVGGGDYFNAKSRLYLGTFEITKADGPVAPGCTFSFDGENAGKLMGATDVMEYSLDGGKNWTACTADTELVTADITSKNGIQIRVKGTDNVNAGEIQTITITEQAAPAAGKTDCTGKDVKGSLTGVSADMEYKLGTEGAWTDITGSTVTGLEGGTYYVRYKASGTKLASQVQKLTIEPYQLKMDKDITKFTIKGVVGTIDSENGTIAVDLPYAADTDITKLTPEITVSPLATVSPASNEVQDFTDPVTYTVTAEDGSTKTYKVTVTVKQLKLTSVTAPEDKTLESFCKTVDAVIAALPDTVTVTTENSSITTLPCAWTCSSTYDKTPGAKNTFHWKANTNGCDVNGQIAEGNVTITNRSAIQLTADAATLMTEKEYDGSKAINGTVAVNSIIGIETTDNVVVKADASYDSKAVGARTITVTYSLEGTDAWKYLPPAQQQQAGNIKKRPVTISGLTAVARDYVKDNCNVKLTGGTINDLVSGEKVKIDLSNAKGTIADDKVGEGRQVAVTGVNLSGEDAGNYVLSEQPKGVTVNIERASYTAGVLMKDYAYGSQPAVPSVDNNPENGAVTYYYNTSNSKRNDKEWKNITATAIPVGTYYMYAVIAQTDNYRSVTTAPVKFTVNGAAPKITKWPAISGTVYVNDAALTDESLTGGSAAVEGKFTISGETKSWSDSGEKQLEIIFMPDDNNYASVKHNITVNVIKRKVISVADSAAITDKTFKTEQSALGLPAEIEITVSGNKKITVPVSWSGYDPKTLDEQTLTGTLDLSEIFAEVQQSENEVKASVRVKLQPIKLNPVSFKNKADVYTGQPIEHKLGNITGVASVKYEYEGAGSTTYDKSESAPVNAGTYNVTATFTMANGYAQLAPASASLTINKADGSVTSPTAIADIVYNGSAQTLINEAVSNTGSVQYKLGENGTYTSDLPKAINAGSYKVYFKVTGDNNHKDVAENSIDATVKKATVVITVNNKSAYVNDKAPDLSKPEADKDYTVTGLIGNEKLETAPILKYTDAENKEIKDPDMTKAGTVTIGASGASAGDNYTVEYKTGTLTINNRRSSGGSTKYTVSAPKSTTGGSVKSDVSNAASGSTVNVTVIVEEGYKLDGLKVTDSKGNEIRVTDKGNGKYTFTMPSDKVEITPVFTKEASEIVNELPFKDVAKGAYYYDAVKWAKDNGITGGVSNDMFGSNASCTRGHIVTFLWRNAGSPEPKSVSSFSDVASNSYYAKAVAWAVENGITNGVGQNKFDPDAVCTRAQSVAFLYRAIGKQAGSKAQFSDVPSNSYYADAVAWAAANDVTNGIGSGLFGSGRNCTRSQIVTLLYRAQQARA